MYRWGRIISSLVQKRDRMMNTNLVVSLTKALSERQEFFFDNGVFVWSYTSSFGGTMSASASIEAMREMLSLACSRAYVSEEDVREYLNGLIEVAEIYTHPRGEIIDSRERNENRSGFLGTGAGTVKVHEVLVRINESFEDWSNQIIVARNAGDEVWYEWEAKPSFGRV